MFISTWFGYILVIQVLIFRHNKSGRERQYTPNLNIEQDLFLFEKYKLQVIVWYHGENIQTSHYTVMSKGKTRSVHLSDDTVGLHPIQFESYLNDRMAPYLLFYSKQSSNTSNTLHDSNIYILI